MSIKRTLSCALQSQNIRQHPLENNERRYDLKTAHGFRKYFKSNAERVMRPLNIEILMDHKTGVSDSYYRPTEQDLQEDYLKAVDHLTIGKDQKIATRFQKRVEEIADKTEQSEQRLAEKEKEAENMKKRLEAVEQIVKKMFVYEYDIDIDLKHPEVLTILPLQNPLSVEICTVLIGCLKS